MHARLDELLSLRDGEPVAAPAARHAAACRTCASEIERLRGLRGRLRALPALPRPERGWDAVARRAYGPLRRRRLLAAAGFGLAASAAWIMASWVLRETPPPAAAPPAMVAAPGANAELIRRSMALETALRTLDYRPNVVRVGTAGTIAEIEDRIALVDYQLSHAAAGGLSDAQSQRLWRQRVDLMGSLVQVRYAQVRQAGY